MRTTFGAGSCSTHHSASIQVASLQATWPAMPPEEALPVGPVPEVLGEKGAQELNRRGETREHRQEVRFINL